jgi:hypothetical protein
MEKPRAFENRCHGDGNPDLGTTRSESDSVDVLLGDGSGKFNRAPSSPVQVSAAKESTLSHNTSPQTWRKASFRHHPKAECAIPSSSQKRNPLIPQTNNERIVESVMAG